MTGFNHKQPADYQFPYKNMLRDISQQIKEYHGRRGVDPNFIIINPGDMDSLIDEMISFKLLVHGKPVGKLQFQGIRIIESPDIIAGFFEVLGN